MHGKNKWERAMKTDLPPEQAVRVVGADCTFVLVGMSHCSGPSFSGLFFFFLNMYLFGCIGS